MTTDKTKIELKPCPFCGGTNLYVGSWSVFCDATQGGCGGGVCARSNEEAVEKWNRRVNDDR